MIYPNRHTKNVMPISQLDPKLDLIQQDQEIDALNQEWNEDFDGYFVSQHDGAFTQIWGFYGSVPVLTKNAYQIL